MIEENLRPLAGNAYRYQKNSVDVYELLKEHGSVDKAIRNAKSLMGDFENRQDYASHNPCTMVWKLVEELLKLKQN